MSQGAYVAGGGMCGKRGASMAKESMHSREGMCGGGHVWWGGHAWQEK